MKAPISPPQMDSASRAAPPLDLRNSQHRVQQLWFASLWAWAGLIAVALSWELWIAPLREGGSWWALKVLPLMLFAPKLWRKHLPAFRGLCLLLWMYVMEAAVRVYSDIHPAGVWMAAAQLLACVALFILATLYIRQRLAVGKQMLAAVSQASSSSETMATTSYPT